LAALPERSGNRRISAGLTVDATADPCHSSSLLTAAQSYQRPSSAAGGRRNMRATADDEKIVIGAQPQRLERPAVATHVRWTVATPINHISGGTPCRRRIASAESERTRGTLLRRICAAAPWCRG